MTPTTLRLTRFLIAGPLLAGAAGCASVALSDLDRTSNAERIALLDRVGWGANAAALTAIDAQRPSAYLVAQLRAGADETLPAEATRTITAMTISTTPVDTLVSDLEKRRKEADALREVEERKAAQRAYQKELNRLGREAAQRSILRALYSPAQLRERMTWFWMNHFSVNQNKANIRALIADYEEHAIRPYALGKFRDLLGATLRHPAMLRYLDNEQSAAGKINENYARELLELHTLGVDGGYGQTDVQELARILTGVGVNLGDRSPPTLKPDRQALYVRDGLFEFNPNRHDFGPKKLLGQAITGQGMGEVEAALDRLARHPSTARFISRKLLQFFVADDPDPALVDHVAAAFTRSDGDIAATLGTLFATPQFRASLGGKFKDPAHYVVSAVRLVYADKVIVNPGPVIDWIARLGEPLYARSTPDGYPLTQAAWASPGQLVVRFDLARAIGSGNADLFKAADAPSPAERPGTPVLIQQPYVNTLLQGMRPNTRALLAKAAPPQQWNALLLASPDFMYR